MIVVRGGSSPTFASLSWSVGVRLRIHSDVFALQLVCEISAAISDSTWPLMFSASFCGILPSRIDRRFFSPALNWIVRLPCLSLLSDAIGRRPFCVAAIASDELEVELSREEIDRSQAEAGSLRRIGRVDESRQRCLVDASGFADRVAAMRR
ncbi:hypothetical protein [Lacipirellula parvula]|uniref:hypothetical protein n=1 Tax=Lacipirellula parvula TaxID=2650471 RepID=UPI001E286EC0|nr:hypothetical protein [Lacipirellula parvula]